MQTSDAAMVSIFSGFQAFASDTSRFVWPNIRNRRRANNGDESAPRPVRAAPATQKPSALLEWTALAPWRHEYLDISPAILLRAASILIRFRDRRGSEHLQTGYRRDPTSLLACVQSLTYLHNETVNIFSHVVGAVLFLGLPFYVFGTDLPPRYQIATTSDVVVCSIYFVGVGVCFTLSTIFHTFMHHSQAAYAFGIQLDYQGIQLLMWGSTFPLIYYGFPCRNNVQVAYWTATTALAGLCSFATFHPSVGGPHLGHIRAILFGSFGFGSFLVPILHGVVQYGLAEQSRKMGLGWIGFTVLFNATGVMAYALKVPEMWFPRRFDIFGASHQVMHIMVVFAALAYSKAVLAAFDYRHGYGISCH